MKCDYCGFEGNRFTQYKGLSMCIECNNKLLLDEEKKSRSKRRDKPLQPRTVGDIKDIEKFKQFSLWS